MGAQPKAEQPKTEQADKLFGESLEGELDSALALAAVAVEELLTRHKIESARKDLEMQLDLRQKFFSLISHDLRQPLTVIKAGADLIRRHPSRVELCSTLSGRIVEAVNRADRMIMDLLDVNRLRAGVPLALNFDKCDLHALVQELLADLTMIHGCSFVYERKDAVLGIWDEGALRRAIINLVTNAIKYGESDKPITLCIEEGAALIRVSVHNFGKPIAADDLPKLFQWHERTPSARQSGKDGWGLGLMLVKGIAEAHGGQISVESSADAGTRFTLTLPLKTLEARPS